MAKGAKTGGRKKGVPNKVTADVREAIGTLLQENVTNMGRWLTSVAADDPGKALDLVVKLAEYHIPKLARSEVTGPEGGAQVYEHKIVPLDFDRIQSKRGVVKQA